MYSKILVPVDGSATSMRGLEEAIQLAKNQGAQIRLVHVVNELVPVGAEAMVFEARMFESMRAGGKRVLQDAEAFARARGLEASGVLLESFGGRSADLIVEQAKAWPADLIVMGTHGRRGLRRLALGSDAEFVLRSAPVPVLMVRQDE
jgi:nucleotide-binding universal stress UspA family protein